MTNCLLASLLALFAALPNLNLQAQTAASPDPCANETAVQRGARMAWRRDACFGMFIHWGVYSVPAGTYDGKRISGIGEWILCHGKIPMAECQKFAAQYNPVKYNPDDWLRLAKQAAVK